MCNPTSAAYVALNPPFSARRVGRCARRIGRPALAMALGVLSVFALFFSGCANVGTVEAIKGTVTANEDGKSITGELDFFPK